MNAEVDKQLTYKFDKQQRLLTSNDFKKVFNNTHFKVHQTNFMWFITLQEDNEINHTTLAGSRLGIAITKKKVKRAHERNRIKRLVREYFRKNHWLLSNEIDMIFTIKQSPENLDNIEIIRQLENSFQLINNKIRQRKSAIKNS